MAGPVLWILLGVRAGSDPVAVSRVIAKLASDRGYGTVFGSELIGHWDAGERRSLELLEKEFSPSFVASITSHPLQTNAAELFDEELGPSRPVNTRQHGFLDFVKRVADIPDARSVVFVVSEDPWMSHELPRRRISIDDFLAHLSRYSFMQADSGLEYGGDGIFILR